MASAPQSSQLRILLVEDHADTRQSLEMWLSRRGYQVLTADCMNAALQAMEIQREIDILLTDIGLPDGDGWMLLEGMISRKTQPAIKAIAMSGFGTLADRARSEKAGFSIHLVKPFGLAQLHDALASPESGTTVENLQTR